jgi:mRNA-degrading endonuclease RelE of RelBE toxin-antitoxin system
LHRRDPKTHRQIQGKGGLFDQLEANPEIGYLLQGEWAGCRAIHIGNDRYRVIWELLPAERRTMKVTKATN